MLLNTEQGRNGPRKITQLWTSPPGLSSYLLSSFSQLSSGWNLPLKGSCDDSDQQC